MLVVAIALLASVAVPSKLGAADTTTVSVHEMPGAANAFVDSIGVNVHLTFYDTNYGRQYEAFRDLLVASGIRHLRDGIVDTTDAQYYRRLSELAHDGVRADLISSISQTPALLRTYADRMRPNTVEALEAPNEYDTVHDSAWPPKLAAFQHVLYETAHRSAAAPIAVVGPSLTTEIAYSAVGDISHDLDFGNSHPYPAGRNPGNAGIGNVDRFGRYGSLAWNLGSARQVSGTKPMFITETGYGDRTASNVGVPPSEKSRYTQRLFLETWNAGVVRTYLYQFLDAGGDEFSSYGIVDAAMHPKPAYYGIKNLIAQLRDPGPAFRLSPLTYSMTAGADVHHTLLERRDGSYALLLWLEIPSWNTVTQTPIPTAPETVTLAFSQRLRTAMTTFNGEGAATTHATGTQDHLTLLVTDSVTIVDLSGGR